ncbi:hypothetical protein [Streptomyces sp. Amel2xC10]|uniref:hypothetical protein n=1 Tax=Streptomyces sp. Amel2xC10 TaxID=1305826 RepID=UPI00117C369C|nr:hypothetical protein [Streptomyces sp. Amel2xC10]
MPAPTRCARGLLAALALGAAGCALRLGATAVTFETGALGAPLLALLLSAAAGCVLTAGAALVVSLRFTEGGAAVRTRALTVGWVTVVGSLAAFLTYDHVWAVGIGWGALVVALSGHRETRAWFERGRLLAP